VEETNNMRKPMLLHYFITNRCNAKCEFCSIWKETVKTDALTEQVFYNLYSAKQAGCRFVDFTGGEPLLHPQLPEFLKEAKRLKFITSVTTNCINFKSQAHKLAGTIDLLHFSLDADTKILHDTIRGAASYDAVLAAIPLAIEHNLAPDILFTYTNNNINAFIGVYALARRYNLMVILDPVFSLDGKDSATAETHAKAVTLSKLPGVYLNKAHLALRAKGGNNINKTFCKAVSSTLVILPDNTLALPCYHHAQEYCNLTESPLQTVIKSEQRLQAMQEQGHYLFCKGCHINCYFDPSFTFSQNPFFLKSIMAKLSYGYAKYLRYGHKPPRLF
jgi:MoaA/NifB/PqqE/SkfB family radical SAM enzyme